VIHPGENTRLKSNWDRLAKIYGADEIIEGVALLNFNGIFYTEGFQFIRYGKKWTIFSLNSSLLSTSSLGSPHKTTEEEFDNAISEVEEVAKRPISE